MKKGLLSIILMALAITFPTQSWAQNNIQFEDDAVKAICVANWDTNGDGELSYDEAAAVTDLGEVFNGNTEIVSFLGLEYFTGLTEISQSAFYHCENLQEVIMPQTITKIGHDAFNGCTKLVSADIPSGVKEIEYQAFVQCYSLTSFVVPDGVTRIPYNAFTGTGVTSIVPPGYEKDNYCGVIPESVTTIENQALACHNLVSVILPAGVQKLDGNPFVGCNALQELIVEEGNQFFHAEGNCIIETATNTISVGCNYSVIPSYAKIIGYCAFCNFNYETFEVPEGIVSIEESAFNNSFYLREVTLPSTLTNLDGYAFYACRELTTLKVKRRTPIAINDIFNETALKTLYVPYGTAERYRNAEIWKNFQNIIEMEKAGDEPEPIAVDLIINGDMEGEDNSSFYYRFLPESTKASPQAITDGVGVDGSRGIKIEASANQDEIYNDEFWFSLSQPVSEGTRFRLSYDARADHEATVYIGAHGPAFFGDFISDWMEPYATFGTEWQTFTMEGTISSDVSSDQKPLASLAFSLSVTPEANNYYFDNVKFEVYLEDQCPKPTFKQTNRGVIIQSPFNATIYYTYDGSTPTTNSEHNEYIVEQFLARSKFTIKAFAVVDGYEPSPVATYNYEYIENASFDRVTAWVSEGVSLDEVFEEVGGREEAAKTIAAIIWENDYPLTAEMLEGINNPNLLVYVNDASLAPQGVQNVVINGVAPEIILTDATTGNNSFFCPQQFRAEKISYTRNFRQHTVIGTSRGWEGLALPFAVQTVTHETQGQITPFRNDDSRKHFWLRQMTDRGLTNAQSIEPMVPYLIAMPNSAEYYDEFNLSGRVTFAAENVIMLETDYIGYGTGEIMLYPNFSVVDTTWEDVYALNVNDAREGWAEGSVFIRNYREVRPFEVYTMHLRNGARPRYIPVNSQTNGNTTGINTIEADSANGTWYSIDGRQLQSEPKTKGVYINNGRKKVVSDLK